MEIPPKLQENKDLLFKGQLPRPKTQMLIPWMVSHPGQQSQGINLLQFQGKAKKVLFQMSCPDTGLAGADGQGIQLLKQKGI